MKFIASQKRFIIFPIIFLLFYTFTAAVPLGSDIYFMPVWIRDLTPGTMQQDTEETPDETTASGHAEVSLSEGKAPQYFLTDTHFGYFTAEGELLRSTPITKRVSASRTAWTEYPETAVNTPVYRPDGSLVTTIDEAGFVHIEHDRFYLFEPGGSAVKQYDSSGKVLWRYVHTAPITAFHSSAQGSVIGFSDGKLVCLNSAGTVLFEFYPGGSNYQVILAAALSENGRFIVCVCGIEQQRVLLIRVDETKYKIVHHRYLEGNLRRQAFAGFNNEGKYAVFECAEGMGLIDCRNRQSVIIPQQERILGIGKQPYKDIIAVMSQKEQTASLSFIEAPLYTIGKTSFPAQNIFLLQEHETLFLAADTKLARIDIKGILK
ncbi:MAG: hypothetical protein P1P65_03280 [Treponema sp.]